MKVDKIYNVFYQLICQRLQRILKIISDSKITIYMTFSQTPYI